MCHHVRDMLRSAIREEQAQRRIYRQPSGWSVGYFGHVWPTRHEALADRPYVIAFHAKRAVRIRMALAAMA